MRPWRGNIIYGNDGIDLRLEISCDTLQYECIFLMNYIVEPLKESMKNSLIYEQNKNKTFLFHGKERVYWNRINNVY